MLLLLGELNAADELGCDDNEKLDSDDALDITKIDADDSGDTSDDVAASELLSDFTDISVAAATASKLFSGNFLNFPSLIDLAGVVGDEDDDAIDLDRDFSTSIFDFNSNFPPLNILFLLEDSDDEDDLKS